MRGVVYQNWDMPRCSGRKPGLRPWCRGGDTFDFDKAADADKCLLQALSTSTGSDPRRKYAENLVTPNEFGDVSLAGTGNDYEWRGFWALVVREYKIRVVTVKRTMPKRLFYRYQPGEEPQKSPHRYTGVNFCGLSDMTELVIPDVISGRGIFATAQLSRLG